MKLKNHFVYCLLIFLLGGCVCEEIGEVIGKMMVELPVATSFYYAENNRWPDSVDELKAFCLEMDKACPDIDWDKYTGATFQVLSDGSLKIESNKSKEQNSSFSMVLTKPKPLKEEDESK